MNANKNIRLTIPVALILLLCAILLSSGCRKEENTFISYHKGINTSQQFVYAQQMMTQLMGTYLKSLSDSVLLETGTSWIDGAKVRHRKDSVNSLFFEYPPWGADDGYGHWRIGTFEAIAGEDFPEEGATVRFLFNDFSWDKDTLTVDSLQVTNLGKLDGTHEHYRFVSGDIRLYYEFDSEFSTFRMDEYFRLLKDPSSPYTTANDSYEIWGSLSGETYLNERFDTHIIEDSSLSFALSCFWIGRGPVVLETEGFSYSSVIHFAPADSCENQYLIEINGNPFPYPIDEY